ncbi:MAG: hypothetical protein J5I91_05525 [Bacteroidetes bacterium]|nr:hypothetical protein [Bacteroidota bacterium]
MKIRYVKYRKISRVKWDALIRRSPQALFYGLSVVYDTMCKRWDALVMGDYEAVMPLPKRKKFGVVSYIFQPYFVQQSGIYAKTEVDKETIRRFVNSIPKKFVRVHCHFNYENDLQGIKEDWVVNKRRSYQIDLNKDYESIRTHYTKDCLKNLRKLEEANVLITNNIKTDLVIDIYKSAYGKLNPGISNAKYQRFALLVNLLEKQNMVEKAAVYQKETLLACGIFIKAFGRIHYCLGAPTEEGRKLGATHLLIDSMIKKFSNQPLFFDFEGSELPNVAAFYKKFGPEENYFQTLEKGLV